MGNSLYRDSSITDEGRAAQRNFGKNLYREILDTNKLKQSNAYWVKFHVVFMFVLLITIITLMMGFITIKYGKFNLIQKEEYEGTIITIFAIIATILSFFSILLLAWFTVWRLDAIKAEDRFVTEMNVVSTQGKAKEQFRDVFGRYIGERFGIHVPYAAEDLGKTLALGDEYGDYISHGDLRTRGDLGIKRTYGSLMNDTRRAQTQDDIDNVRGRLNASFANKAHYTEWELHQHFKLNELLIQKEEALHDSEDYGPAIQPRGPVLPNPSVPPRPALVVPPRPAPVVPPRPGSVGSASAGPAPGIANPRPVPPRSGAGTAGAGAPLGRTAPQQTGNQIRQRLAEARQEADEAAEAGGKKKLSGGN